MRWFDNLATGRKLALGFALVSLLTAGVAWNGVSGMAAMHHTLEDIHEVDVVGALALEEASGALLKISGAVRDAIIDAVIDEDHAAVDRRAADIKRDEAVFLDAWEKFEARLRLDTSKVRAAELEKQFREMRQQQDEVVVLARNDRDGEARERLTHTNEMADRIDRGLAELVVAKERLMQEAMQRAADEYRSRRTTVFVVLALVLVAGTVVGRLVSRMIVRSLKSVVDVAERASHGELDARVGLDTHDELGQMGRALDGFLDVLQHALRAVMEVAERAAAGDLDRRVQVDRTDEIGRMGQALNGFLDALQAALRKVVTVTEQAARGDLTCRVHIERADEIGRMAAALDRFLDTLHDGIAQVAHSSGTLASASEELSAGSEQLSIGATEQASSLEQTAASLQEMAATIKQSADNARQASQAAIASRETAEAGGQVVSDAVGAMGEISQAARRIADIITAIDEIAFQTNLLALNAAVEAARAGEQGRGFAVVAAEVRNLAQRSATAAKEIKALIQDSVARVETGASLVNRSGKTLGEIVNSVKRVTDIIAEIAAASMEQATGIDQVTRAVAEIDKVTQANSAQTEELSGTARALASQAEELQALVARFTLRDGAAAKTRARGGARTAGPKRAREPQATVVHAVASVPETGTEEFQEF